MRAMVVRRKRILAASNENSNEERMRTAAVDVAEHRAVPWAVYVGAKQAEKTEQALRFTFLNGRDGREAVTDFMVALERVELKDGGGYFHCAGLDDKGATKLAEMMRKQTNELHGKTKRRAANKYLDLIEDRSPKSKGAWRNKFRLAFFAAQMDLLAQGELKEKDLCTDTSDQTPLHSGSCEIEVYRCNCKPMNSDLPSSLQWDDLKVEFDMLVVLSGHFQRLILQTKALENDSRACVPDWLDLVRNERYLELAHSLLGAASTCQFKSDSCGWSLTFDDDGMPLRNEELISHSLAVFSAMCAVWSASKQAFSKGGSLSNPPVDAVKKGASALHSWTKTISETWLVSIKKGGIVPLSRCAPTHCGESCPFEFGVEKYTDSKFVTLVFERSHMKHSCKNSIVARVSQQCKAFVREELFALKLVGTGNGSFDNGLVLETIAPQAAECTGSISTNLAPPKLQHNADKTLEYRGESAKKDPEFKRKFSDVTSPISLKRARFAKVQQKSSTRDGLSPTSSPRVRVTRAFQKQEQLEEELAIDALCHLGDIMASDLGTVRKRLFASRMRRGCNIQRRTSGSKS